MSFRAPKRKHVKTERYIRDSDSEEESQDASVESKNHAGSNISVEDAVDYIKTWQNLRKRRAGVSAESLFVGKKIEPELLIEDDPYKLKTGGLVEMRGTFRKPMKDELEDEVRLSKTFTAETNKRDEDADITAIDSILNEIPEALRPKMGQQSEDMLSNQMLCGIPEVDLGVEAKMRNIEATEEAKQRLLQERLRQRQKQAAEDADLTPYNMSVNFVQHNRWNNYVDQTLHKELSVQDGDATDKSGVPELSGILDPPAIEAEKRRLQAEKSSDAKVLQRYKNYLNNKRGR
ncbi:unnamed protein product [Rodentolepis nana]|uniref:Hepatocellular carcinoma-associated antigen 59-domain-containing protein n=1 Tax=Rodentolepis nana TaxID=102285 RepID=A0A0R3TUE8_RODNA|nr:unnamed protein product [Rodentolepis nana]